MKQNWIEIVACLTAFMMLSLLAMAVLITGEVALGSPRTGFTTYASGGSAFAIGCLLLALAFGALGYLARYWRFYWLVWLALGLSWGGLAFAAWSWRLQFMQ